MFELRISQLWGVGISSFFCTFNTFKSLVLLNWLFDFFFLWMFFNNLWFFWLLRRLVLLSLIRMLSIGHVKIFQIVWLLRWIVLHWRVIREMRSIPWWTNVIKSMHWSIWTSNWRVVNMRCWVIKCFVSVWWTVRRSIRRSMVIRRAKGRVKSASVRWASNISNDWSRDRVRIA